MARIRGSVRRQVAGGYKYDTFATADDLTPPDGKANPCHTRRRCSAHGAAAQGSTRLTVRDALERYLDALDARSAHAGWARKRAEFHPSRVGKYPRRSADARANPRTGERLGCGATATRRPSARVRTPPIRLMTLLRAALNAAYADRSNNIASEPPGVASSSSKKSAVPLGLVDDRAGALAHHGGGALRQAARRVDRRGVSHRLPSGELVTLDVRDIDAGERALHVRHGKTGERIVTLSVEACTLLAKCANDREAKEPLLPNANGERWRRCGWVYPFKRAAKAAGLPPSVTFYALRHSHISSAVVSGLPLPVLAENTGTSVLMIEQTYFKAGWEAPASSSRQRRRSCGG